MKIFLNFIFGILCVLFIACSTSKSSFKEDEKRPYFEKDIFPPFSRLSDTTITGYKTWYSLHVGPFVLNDTVPYPIDAEGCYANDIYEVYVYKGMPRITKYLSTFRKGNYYDINKSVVDRSGWCSQNELGLEEKPTEYQLQEPLLPAKFEIDSSENYNLDDIEFIIYGSVHERHSQDLFRFGSDSLFTYFTRDGFAEFSVDTDYHIDTDKFFEGGLSFRMSNIPDNYSDISVYPYPQIKEVFDAFPIDLLNGNSCAFEADTKTRVICMECGKYYLRVKLKDGKEKLWTFYRCPLEGSCQEAQLQVKGMNAFINKLKTLHFLPSDMERYRRL